MSVWGEEGLSGEGDREMGKWEGGKGGVPYFTEDDIRRRADGGSISLSAYTRSVRVSWGGRPGEGGAEEISESIRRYRISWEVLVMRDGWEA